MNNEEQQILKDFTFDALEKLIDRLQVAGIKCSFNPKFNGILFDECGHHYDLVERRIDGVVKIGL